MHTDTIGIAAGQQSGARSRTNGLSHVKIAKDAALGRQMIEMRRLKTFGAEDADIGVALVIGEDDDDVRQRCGPGVRNRNQVTEKENEDRKETRIVGHSRSKERFGGGAIHGFDSGNIWRRRKEKLAGAAGNPKAEGET